jgi:superfamily II DNA or RNA helicase
MDIALNSKSKIEELKEILADNKGTKTIIFTQHNRIVYEISNNFLIPYITYKTDKDERQDVLKGFRERRYNAIVTSKVLDEGVDVPDAELGIILSGTGSGREFIQRLGRLLRPKSDVNKKARLIEITSAETREIRTSAKRKKALRNEGMKCDNTVYEVKDVNGNDISSSSGSSTSTTKNIIYRSASVEEEEQESTSGALEEEQEQNIAKKKE